MVYKKYIKRLIDFIVALATLAILSPLIVIIACLIKLKLGSPVLFKQRRPGLNEKIFTIYKFRTMSNINEIDSKRLSDSERLTKFGKTLRATSLDELPELYNILKGDMAIVGPRPLLERYLPYYTNEEKLRHSIRPGLTGLAQINGRNLLGWEKRLSLDVQYANNISFVMDLKIFLKTIWKVISRADVIVVDVSLNSDLDVERRETSDNKNFGI